MEQVFDLREFVCKIFKKGLAFLAAGIVLAAAGAAYGYTRTPEQKYTSTSSASVNITDSAVSDSTAITAVMTAVRESITSDFFYNDAYETLETTLGAEAASDFFSSSHQPSVADLKNTIRLSASGNLIFAAATSKDSAVATTVSDIIIENIISKLSQNISNVNITKQGSQVINTGLQEYDGAVKTALKYSIIGFIAGIVLVLVWVFFFDIMTLKLKSADDLKKFLLPILGEITLEKAQKQNKT